jgi:surfactin synthase thioesterase subunit
MRTGDRDGTAATVTRMPLLHCFPHAGGSPAAFRRWPGAVAGVEVVPVDLERGDGIARPTIESLADGWRRRTPERSGVYYGHSMGALVAYEAAAQALAAGDDLHQVPRAVVLAAPPTPGRCVPVGARRGATTSADAALGRGLDRVRRYRPACDRLPIPVHVLWGALDDVVPEADARRWVLRGAPGSSWHRVERAGHLFHHLPGPELRDVLDGLLRRAEGSAA